MHFVPPEYYVGDRVELRIDYTFTTEMDIAVPDSLPEDKLLTIHDLRVEEYEKSLSVFISFTSFAPGIQAFPPIDLGSVNLQNVKIFTHSMLPDAYEGVRRLRGQMLLPGTRLALAIILAAAAMSPFLLYTAMRLMRKLFRWLKAMIRIHKPARRLRRQLKRLRAGIEVQSASEWYLSLTRALRVYLSTRLACNCRCATTSEISLLANSNSENAPQVRILQVLKDGDMVKFARRSADTAACRNALATVEEAVHDWEKTVARL